MMIPLDNFEALMGATDSAQEHGAAMHLSLWCTIVRCTARAPSAIAGTSTSDQSPSSMQSPAGIG